MAMEQSLRAAARRPRSGRFGVWFAAVLASAGVEAQMPTHAGQYEQADIEYGARLYSGHCVTCHGERGDTMPGANLASGKFRHAETDRDISNIIRNGVPGTAMAPSAYTDSELSAIVAYLRNMGSVDLRLAAQGDPVRGRALFEGRGNCGSCHRVGAVGPRFAPDLSNVGATRTAATLQRVLVDPNAALLPINAQVRAELSDGTVVTGRRLNEDTFTVRSSIQRGLYRSIGRRFAVHRTAKMPSYAMFHRGRGADVVAYLLSLKGQRVRPLLGTASLRRSCCRARRSDVERC
jgi:putative heme-binding domain-containing protein